jgi:glycosyltransferase involved in cell wall biosynthesis
LIWAKVVKIVVRIKMKLSIIVPVYGVAPYLRKCVDSLLKQDIPSLDYEIILVDDGSPDECPQICDEYAEKYDNIRVVHQENAGLSAARNSGIKVATGDYIMFVDSDDYLQPNVLGTLMEQVERDNLDVLRFNYQNINEQYEVFRPFKDAKRDVDYSEDVVDGETFLNKRLGPACYAVMFIVRRELLDTCLFTPNIYFEDTDWTPRMLISAQRVASTPMVVYNYLWRQGSITLPTESKKREKVLRDKMSLLHGFKAQMKQVQDASWYVWITSFNTMTILNMLASMPSTERKLYIQELKSLGIFPLYTKKEKGLKRLKIQIANFSPALYCGLMNLRNK